MNTKENQAQAAEAEADSEEMELEEPEERLVLIPWLIAVLRWIEELIVALSGYGITFAVGVGVVDLLTDGQFTQQNPWVDFAYAVSFAAALAGQIVGLASRSSRSFGKGQWVRGIAYFLLVLLLAFTEYQASIIFAYHKTFGIPVTASLAQLGIGGKDFINLRIGVSIFLAVLSGFLRYQPKKRKSIAQLQKEAEYKRQADEIAAQNRAQGIKNIAGLAGNLGQGVRAAVKNATESGDVSEPTVAAPPAAAPPVPVQEVAANPQ